MKVTEKDIQEKYINVWSTKKVKELMIKEDKGIKLKMDEKIWFDNKSGIRKANIKFASTQKEINEFTKCKMDIHYFANNYCQIKREDGTIGPMKLRDYQKDIIDLFQNKRSILMASRQTGKCNTFSIKVLAMNSDGVEEIISVGQLYYDELQRNRKLTLSEKIKLVLYKLLDKLNNL